MKPLILPVRVVRDICTLDNIHESFLDTATFMGKADEL